MARAATLVSVAAALCVIAGAPEWQQSAAPGSLDDLAQMRALGFNVIRLPVSWSQLEPTPGRYSTSYIDRISAERRPR